ncbi:MAG TPA: endolytic transglycosylase MltG [Rhodothermales bacterium]|nr:endolytic transglycosylase MltG [Rhodothermales bacterium]
MRRTALVVGLLVAVGIAAAVGMLAGSATEDFDGPRVVNIAPGSTFDAIADSLKTRGILNAEGRFRLVARITGWHRHIKAGHYLIESGTSVYQLLNILRKGLQTPLRITVPPGTRVGVIAAAVQNTLGVDSATVKAAFADPELAAELGTDTLHLFGYMLPETIDFFWGTSAEQVVRRLKQAFDEFFSDEMRARAAELGLSEEEVLTLASIVEWEARVESERGTIAGVYMNRLRIRMPLQADPTVQYAVMKAEGSNGSRRLLYSDYKLEHPFNTYLYYGLPPGPITNPSPASIRAVLEPEDHEFLFFVADGSGGHIFSRTLREHNNAANSYREMMQERRKLQAESE